MADLVEVAVRPERLGYRFTKDRRPAMSEQEGEQLARLLNGPAVHLAHGRLETKRAEASNLEQRSTAGGRRFIISIGHRQRGLAAQRWRARWRGDRRRISVIIRGQVRFRFVRHLVFGRYSA